MNKTTQCAQFQQCSEQNRNDTFDILHKMNLITFSDPVRPPTENASSTNSSPMITPTRSNTDLPNTVGNTARRDDGNLVYIQAEEHQPQHQRSQWWESNYKEASIFLDEGANNDKFSHHPRSYDHLPAYLLVHNYWFNFLDFGKFMI